MKDSALARATRSWVDQFDAVPASIITKMALCDREMADYDSDSFRLASSPTLACEWCGEVQEDVNALDIDRARERCAALACQRCRKKEGLTYTRPDYFPCSWGWLWAPPRQDLDWFLANRHRVSSLGFYVFESDDYGILLGIDAGGFDFYEAYWIPLYKLRGLCWHERAA